MGMGNRERRTKLLTIRIKPEVLQMLIDLQGPVPKGRKKPGLSQADIIESLVEQAYIEHAQGKPLR